MQMHNIFTKSIELHKMQIHVWSLYMKFSNKRYFIVWVDVFFTSAMSA